jgi:thioredoxin 1
MAYQGDYTDSEPKRADIDALREPILLEFGSPWCGHCSAAQPLLEEAFLDHPNVRHIKIADGRGRRLGRTFGVKLWPTLVFMRDGEEQARLVRPRDLGDVRQGLERIDPAGAGG